MNPKFTKTFRLGVANFGFGTLAAIADAKAGDIRSGIDPFFAYIAAAARLLAARALSDVTALDDIPARPHQAPETAKSRPQLQTKG